MLCIHSRSAFQAEGAKANTLRRKPIVQRALTESRRVGRQIVEVHKSLRSLGLENRATMLCIHSRSAFQAEGAKDNALRRKLIVRRALTESRRVGGQIVEVRKSLRSLGLENRATMLCIHSRSAFQAEGAKDNALRRKPILQRARTESRGVGRQIVAVRMALRSLGLENRATMLYINSRSAFQAEGAKDNTLRR